MGRQLGQVCNLDFPLLFSPVMPHRVELIGHMIPKFLRILFSFDIFDKASNWGIVYSEIQ